MKPTLFIAASLTALLLPACQSTGPAAPADASPVHDHSAHDHASHSHGTKTKAKTLAKPSPVASTPAGVKSYPLATCVVTGEPLGEWDEETTYIHGNHNKTLIQPSFYVFTLKIPSQGSAIRTPIGTHFNQNMFVYFIGFGNCIGEFNLCICRLVVREILAYTPDIGSSE